MVIAKLFLHLFLLFINRTKNVFVAKCIFKICSLLQYYTNVIPLNSCWNLLFSVHLDYSTGRGVADVTAGPFHAVAVDIVSP